MRHIFRFIMGIIKHNGNAFWKSFTAGTVAYFGILLHVSPPLSLDILGATWILGKAFAVGFSTAMGTTLWVEIYSRYKNRKIKDNGKRRSEKEKAA